ncbi:hypothetical protein LTR54_009925 [Friedmanniomyces endolithicus]|nr:hypothetical protein LTR73_008219 [Friedmanniomyces endolithicus]KAK0996849.1 hypothetical protein LTR54_009925 [Friedmanniomyces endolithicus]
MKSDNYLTLCLEQAAKSSLHYRHGCIIVRGGKVIGQGYNDYRPGYEGGTLKHGRIAKCGLDGPAIAELKEKMKKQKNGPREQQRHPQFGNTFKPCEGAGGGHQANVPLSMHSEMMAIHSALAASGTLSSTALASEKPCFKLPRGDKRKARLRAESLKRYVETVCSGVTETGTTTQGAGNAVLKLPHLNQVVHHHAHNKTAKPGKEELYRDEEEEEEEEEELEASRRHMQRSGVQHAVKECHRAFHAPPSGEKHHHHQKRKEKDGKKVKEREYEYEGQYDRDGQHIQQGHGRQQQEVSASRQRTNEDTTMAYDNAVHGVMTDMSRQACKDALGDEKAKKSHKPQPGDFLKRIHDEPPQPIPMLLPMGRTGSNTNERKKNLRLVGADLYVARLGRCKTTGSKGASPREAPIPVAKSRMQPEDYGGTSLESSVESLSITTSTKPTGSLHDDLADREPTPRRVALAPATLDLDTIRSSRPCYRCINDMHTAGIKRVFWTNDAGGWEGATVRDLIDALDDSMENVASGVGGGPTGNGVFVTKHEVLMLKRLMGEGSV